MRSNDPVSFYDAGMAAARGWYFWDETWAGRYGPYATEEEARKALAEYCEHMAFDNTEEQVADN